MPVNISVPYLLDSLMKDVVRKGELVKDVGRWFAWEFIKQSAEEMFETVNDVRPILRDHGFDICDSDYQEPVGCHLCMAGGIDSKYDNVRVSLSDASEGFDAEMKFRVELSDDYSFGFYIPVKYCPMCGRRLEDQ